MAELTGRKQQILAIIIERFIATGEPVGSKAICSEMGNAVSSATIRNNDQVVTTGSTVYPRDLILGYVVDAGFDDTGVAKFAVLEPAAEIASLEQIFILTNYTTE